MDHVTTPDGLHLEVLTMGPHDGYPLVHHSGSPSAAVRCAAFEPVLDALGIGEFVTLGWSGGGPRALTCAAPCRRAAARRCHWQGSRHTAYPGSTGPPAWFRRTCGTSRRRSGPGGGRAPHRRAGGRDGRRDGR